MGFPHQVLPTVALLDVASALAASLRLGLVPSPRLFGAAGQTSFLDRLFASTTAPTLASQAANAVVTNPRRLLFVMLATCVARCFVIVIVWSSVKVGIQAGRVGARSEDYSGRAIGYSAVCIVSHPPSMVVRGKGLLMRRWPFFRCRSCSTSACSMSSSRAEVRRRIPTF